MAEIQTLILRQRLAIDQLSKWQVNFRKDSKARKTAIYYENLIEKVRLLHERFTEIHERILEKVDENIVNLAYFSEEYDKFENSHLNFQSELEDALQAVQRVDGKVQAKSQFESKVDELELKLPRINLPKFVGNYEDWVSFKDLYVSLIHDRTNISKVEKLHYLKCSLGGEAERLLQHLLVTDANYDSAWKLLNDRYDNKRVLLNAQFKRLVSISNASESASALKTLLDRTVECVQSIENLKLGDLWQSIVVYMTTQRLPQETRQLWEQNQALKTELPSFDELQTFIHQRFRALEASGVERSKSFQDRSHIRQSHSVQTQASALCVHCRGSHRLIYCTQFKSLSQACKFTIVKQNGLCLNCLEKGHLVVNCPSKSRCFKCNKSHHTLLHRELSETSDPSIPTASTSRTERVNVAAVNLTTQREVLLATALVTIDGVFGPVTLRALLDQGSQTSLITDAAVQQLGLKRRYTNINVFGIGSSNGTVVKGTVNLELHTSDESVLEFDALIMNKLTNLIPTKAIHTSEWSQLRGLKLSDPFFDRPGQIDILLGADVVGKILNGEILHLTSGPIAQSTKLGWVISGQLISHSVNNFQTFKIEVNDKVELNEQLQKFWELEEIRPRQIRNSEEDKCESFFINTTTRDHTGRFMVRLPFKSDEHKNSLGYSRTTAYSSLLSLERRFQKDEKLKLEYSKCMQEYLDLGHMQPVDDTLEHVTDGKLHKCVTHYLPHHAVMKESTTSSCRVVFDASRKTSSGISLNDTLWTGPTIQNDLNTILMRWRWHKFAFVADIAKMYRQIQVHPDDAQYQRILWRSDTSKKVQDYLLNRVTFGITCAPFLAIRTLRKLAEDEKLNYPNAFKSIMNEFYVDDLLSGGQDIQEAINKRQEIVELLRSGGFPLRKWIANDTRILKGLPANDIEMQTSLDLNLDQTYKSLGIMWHPLSDYFSYRIQLNEEIRNYSKRQVLSDIARLFDPLGWLSPIIINAKILMQSLWIHGLQWDEPLSDELSKNWIEFRTNLLEIRKLRIPRWVNYLANSKIELHGFSDASLKAYAAAVYLVVRNGDESHAHLIVAKTKVAPIRPVSIPRLELCGALLLAKLIANVKLTLELPDVNSWLWSDSEIVLAWLKGHPAKWNTFVSNRTTEIFNHVGNAVWRHVPSKQNPADLASRGIATTTIFDNSLWWHGPNWLTQPQDCWPERIHLPLETTMELRKTALVNTVSVNDSHMELILNKYSTLNKLIRVTAYCRRFLVLASKRNENRGCLTREEFQQALNIWIKYTQHNAFTKDILKLNVIGKLDNNSKLLKLHPFLDGFGILRVGGRLAEAHLPYDAKYPIILPKNGKLVNLIIQQTHRNTLHGQTQLMLNTIRKRYWIIDARNSIKHHIHKCVACFRAKPRLSTQLMGNLPTPRVNISRPFTHTGVDYCGPFEYRDKRGRGHKLFKGYIAIFVCLAVKAIHIEFVGDLSSATFLASLKRFTARRGLCNHIYSDCGSNFIGADSELQRIVKANSKEAAGILANDNVMWHFNPPASPHFGGLWEAGVKSIKQHLRRVIGNATLTYEEMSTVLIRIEACLNSRPLCPLSDDPTDLEVLTPAHFLIGGSLLAPPEQNLLNLKVNYLDRWQFVQRLVQHFWNKWKFEYLNRLQSRPKWLKEAVSPRVGDICILKDERLLNYKWPLARITELHPGKDSLVRVVSVFINGKIFKRPVSKIALLPIQK